MTVPNTEGGTVVIVDCDPRWPAMFEEEKVRILATIGPHVVAVEHIGSTAVPGLAAKPIIDILVGIRWLHDARLCIGPLAAIGYEYVPEYEDELPERRYFRKGPPGGRTHHVHMVEVMSDFWDRHLRFRDYLRAHPEEARRYDALKRKLAAKFGADREAYTNAKAEYVRSVEAKARSGLRAG